MNKWIIQFAHSDNKVAFKTITAPIDKIFYLQYHNCCNYNGSNLEH